MTPDRAAAFLQSGNQEVQAIAMAYIKLQEAAQNLYYSAMWVADRPCKEDQLWTELRDAAGLRPGNSPEPTPAHAAMIVARQTAKND